MDHATGRGDPEPGVGGRKFSDVEARKPTESADSIRPATTERGAGDHGVATSGGASSSDGGAASDDGASDGAATERPADAAVESTPESTTSDTGGDVAEDAPEPWRMPPPTEAMLADDTVAISRLKFRYLRSLDTKSWDEFADTMIPDATATYSEYLQFESREAFLTFMRNTLGPHVITEHRCEHPEIDVVGDTATGTWYLADTVLIPGNNMMLRGAAFYSDRYVRCEDGNWRIAHTGYERTYEVVLSLSDLPSLRLTSSKWGLFADEGGTFSSVEREPHAAPTEPDAEFDTGEHPDTGTGH